MKKTVFWSWQSDLPPNVTKDFIKGALSQALKNVAAELELEAANRIELDHDTKGEAGLVEIVTTIFNKIDDCEVFVADITPVTTITSNKRDKKIPNPNVMIELGYALGEVGHKRSITVANLAFGGEHEELPFDLRHRRGAITYALESIDDPLIEKTRRTLIKELTAALKTNLAAPREDRMIRNPQPDLTLETTGDMPQVTVVEQNATVEGIRTLEEIMAATPVRSEADQVKPEASFDWPIYQDIFSRGRTRPKAFREWTQDELDGYNKKVHRYYEAYTQYLEDVKQHCLWMQRSITVKLIVANGGTLPATDVTAHIDLPPEVLAYDTEALPPPPEPPNPPYFAPYGHGSMTRVHSPEISVYEPRKALKIAEDHRSIEFRSQKIQHRYGHPLPPFTLLFSSVHDVKSFDAEYLITADEVRILTKKKLRFEVQLSGR